MKSFFHDERGSFAILFGILMIPLIGVVGLAIDSARAFTIRGQIQQALDSAALAGGRVFYSTQVDRNTVIRSYFDNNVKNFRYQTNITSADVQIDSNTSTGMLTLHMTAKMPTLLMGVLGFKSVPISATAQVRRNDEDKGIELAMALDMSGSMNEDISGCATCTPSRLSLLKTAATNLISFLFTDMPANKVYISIVPWNSQTYPGLSYTSWLVSPAPTSTTSVLPPWWYGALYMRNGGDDLNDKSPLVSKFRYSPYGYDPYTAEDNRINTIKPLSSSQSELLDKINILIARGWTNSTVGLFWGWMTLSPKWRNIWNGVPSTRPLDYTDTSSIKALILMTDGEDNHLSWSYSPAAVPDDDITDPNDHEARDWIEARSLQTCTRIKENGIRIYTVAFTNEVATNTTVIDFLKACATTGYFFVAPDGTTLNSAFQSIGSDLKSLRLIR